MPRQKTMSKTAKKKPAKTGPKADLLKIDDKWQEAVRRSLAKRKPPDGWPKDK
jgi:hypothetical protein